MPTLAAIDIGSNALRLSLAAFENAKKFAVVGNFREAVRLGQDVFSKGVISDTTMDEALSALSRFKEEMERYSVSLSRAVATSALREALNKDMFVDRVSQACGIDIAVIGAEEEARLIHLAVADVVNLKNKTAILVDIGGGSIEVTLAVDGSIVSTESYRLGAVRLLQLLEGTKHGERTFHQLVREYVDSTQQRLKQEIGSKQVQLCIGTGGNIEALGALRKEMLGKDRDSTLASQELDTIVKKLQGLSIEERITQLRLRPDRADVIVPASIILQRIVSVIGVDEVIIPKVGLKDGILMDLAGELFGEIKFPRREQVMASALQIGRKYLFDEQHGTSVARYAVQLFDQTRSLHNLSLEHRLLLEVAALLHDVGAFVTMTGHHKHTQYLLLATPVMGLNQLQMSIVANIARYHRKSQPKLQHDSYRLLSPKDRVIVSKLTAILRVADAMDNEHAGKVKAFSVEYKRPKFSIALEGDGDLLLEKWALKRKGGMFEEVFGVKINVAE